MLSLPRLRSPFAFIALWLIGLPIALYCCQAALVLTAAESSAGTGQSPVPFSIPPTPPETLDENSIRLMFIGIGTAVLLGLLNGTKTILDIVKSFRADPPLHQVYASKTEVQDLKSRVETSATKEEIRGVETRLAQRIDRAETDQEKHLKGIYDELKTINRAVGRLEGHGHD